MNNFPETKKFTIVKFDCTYLVDCLVFMHCQLLVLVSEVNCKEEGVVCVKISVGKIVAIGTENVFFTSSVQR